MGLDILGGPDQRSVVLPDLSVPAPLTEAITHSPSAALASSLGNSGIQDALSGSLGGVLEDLVRQQVESAGVFDTGIADPLSSNTDVNKLLFGSESPMVAMAERARELSAELGPPEEQGATASQAPTATVEGPQPPGGIGDAFDLSDALGGDLAGQLGDLAGGELSFDQVTGWARSILEQQGRSLFEDARGVLDGELSPLLELQGATDALHELGQLGDGYDDLLREQAGMFAELLASEHGAAPAEGAATDPASTATAAPASTTGSTADAAATPDAGRPPVPELATLEDARDLLLHGMPQLTRVFDGDLTVDGASALSGVFDGWKSVL